MDRQESMNFVTACHQVESVVIHAPIGTVWEALKSFSWDKLFPSHVKNVKFTQGSPTEIGSSFQVEFAQGDVWEYRLVHLSELKREFAYELVSADPQISFSSLLNTVRLHKVSADDTTYLQWESDYSNDVNAHVVQDGKYKKLDYFKDLKKALEKQ